MSREKDMADKLQQDIVIPAVVQERAELAFCKIKSEREQGTMKIKKKKRNWKTVWIAVAAAVLALATTACAAMYLQWSKGLETELKVTEKQKQKLEETQTAAPVSDSVTDQGITVTAVQTIADNYFVYLAFQVNGYETAEGVQPDFENMIIRIDGSDEGYDMLGGAFFNGLKRDSEGNVTYLDGSPVRENAQGGWIERYADENGSMEYTMLLMTASEGESFVGKPLYVEFHNLGTVEKAQFKPDVEGTWAFDFTLKGSEEARQYRLSEALGDTGATVIEAEISPISLRVVYDMPIQMTEIDGVDENGQSIQSSMFVEAPHLTGVRLKDGTFLTGITGGGQEGYMDGSGTLYRAVFATGEILEPEEVDALLFVKSYPEGEMPLTEENLYIVPVE